MSDVPFVEERRNAILHRLKQDGRVSVSTLSDLMGVSAVTIRQDLRLLEQAGLLQRTYGGAIPRNTGPAMPELSFHVRQARNSRDKEVIGRYAAQFVYPGDSIAMDASSTVAAMIPFLKPLTALTVVTNSLYVAQSFLDSPQVQVLMPGGKLRRDAISLVGRPDLLPNIHLNIGFFGAVGISQGGGVTDVDRDEVLIKQAMIKRCSRSMIVADGDKWGKLAPYTVIPPDAIKYIVTTMDVPVDTVEWFRESGATVDLVEVE